MAENTESGKISSSSSNWNEIQRICQEQKRRKTQKELQYFQDMQLSDDDSNHSVSSKAESTESTESGEISSSCSEWSLDSDRELFVTCLNDNSDKLKKPIKNYLDLFINPSLNHTSIRSFLVS